MKINAKEIELFKNLALFEFRNKYYDFHNDYICMKIELENQNLSFLFEESIEHVCIEFIFRNVDVEKFCFEDFPASNELILDNLYRGRFEKENNLFEFSEKGKSFFYLEFYEGGKIEFWSDEIQIDRKV